MERKKPRGRRHLAAPFFTLFLLAMLMLAPSSSLQAAAKIKGIDVSKWQGSIDWAKVKKAGVKFVMLGTGRYLNGQGIPDPYFEYNIKGALEQNISVGVYLYSMAKTEDEARQEAMYVLDQIDGYKISYPVAFDIEDDIHRKLTTKQRTDITIAFLEIIEEAGYYPMIYASENWLNENMDLTRLTKYDKWVARWADSTPFRPLDMWQYSSTGRVKGIAGYVDLDYSYRNYAKIITPRTKAKPVGVKAGWNTDGKNYWYIQKDGTRLKDCVRKIGKKTYCFDKEGNRVSGWKKISGKYYYFSKSNGAMRTGWIKVGGKYYYLDKRGVRHTGWVVVDGKKYYLDSKGVRQYKWLKLGKNKYWLRKKDGSMYTGWLNFGGGSVYYFDKKTGRMVTGWLTSGTKKYYLRSSGIRAAGWTKVSGKWYYFDKKTGVMKKNCYVGQYKLDASGVCRNYK